MAVISMWFALASAVGINGILAFPVAVFWGLVIMGIDRWLVTSMPVDGKRKWGIAVPRVLLAILLGTLISTPLVLRVFESEINAQMAKMQTANYNSYLKSQASGQLTKQISTYSTELQYLNTVIDSHGVSTGNTAADPELVAYNNQLATLNKQLTSWTNLKAQYYKDYTCQKYGGADCPKAGVGPAAQASLTSYNQASAQVTSVQGQISRVQQEIQARNKQINDNSVAGQQNRYQQALNQRPLVQNEYNQAVQQQNQQEQAYYLQNQASHGILARLEALSQLSSGNFTVAAARFFLFLLFLVIECLPVTVKLLQKPGHYEAALQRAKAAEGRDVDMFYSSWSGYQGSGGPAPFAAAPAAVSRDPGPRQAEPQPVAAAPAADVFGIWNPTKVMSPMVGDPEDGHRTELIDERERPDFPPSEHDPRAAHGWRQSHVTRPQGNGDGNGNGNGNGNAGARDGGPAQGERDQGGLAWDEAVEAPGAAPTRPDYGYVNGVTRRDEYRQEVAPPQVPSYPGEDRALHEALSQVEDEEPPSSYPDGSSAGIALNWDDE